MMIYNGKPLICFRKCGIMRLKELANVAIYLLGLSEIPEVDLASEIERKMKINQERSYQMIDGKLVRASE